MDPTLAMVGTVVGVSVLLGSVMAAVAFAYYKGYEHGSVEIQSQYLEAQRDQLLRSRERLRKARKTLAKSEGRAAALDSDAVDSLLSLDGEDGADSAPSKDSESSKG